MSGADEDRCPARHPDRPANDPGSRCIWSGSHNDDDLYPAHRDSRGDEWMEGESR